MAELTFKMKIVRDKFSLQTRVRGGEGIRAGTGSFWGSALTPNAPLPSPPMVWCVRSGDGWGQP